ncbi:hypothetical protein IM40_10590 (plasmid) [Candidatus Paracaedimonas acanthamoebae]|nr:hypothetical protein IM40_10590 [Candidatus Paracaedimonas acanthamoebae]
MSKFIKPPLSKIEKEKKAEEFLSFVGEVKVEDEKLHTSRRLEKEPTKSYPLRIPTTLFDDLREIGALTGISINAICLELLRPVVKKKLKELKDLE